MKKGIEIPIEKKPYEKPTLQKRERLDQVAEGAPPPISGIIIT